MFSNNIDLLQRRSASTMGFICLSLVPSQPIAAPMLAVPLRGVALTRPNEFNSPMRLLWTRSGLVVLDRNATPIVRTISDATGETISSFGTRLDPYFGGAWSISETQPVGGTFGIFDASKKVFNYVTRGPLGAGAIVRSVGFGEKMRLTEVHPLGGMAFIGTGFLSQGRFAILRSDGKLERMFGAAPGDSKNLAPFEVRIEARLATLATDPAGGRFVSAGLYSDRLEMYGANGALIALGTRPVGFEPIFRVMRSSSGVPFMGETDGTRLGYLAVAATDQHVYALYSGRTRAESKIRKAYLGSEIRVFTWHGRLVNKYRTDRDVNAIAISADEDALYALAAEPYAVVVRYPLPNQRRLPHQEKQ